MKSHRTLHNLCYTTNVRRSVIPTSVVQHLLNSSGYISANLKMCTDMIRKKPIMAYSMLLVLALIQRDCEDHEKIVRFFALHLNMIVLMAREPNNSNDSLNAIFKSGSRE